MSFGLKALITLTPPVVVVAIVTGSPIAFLLLGLHVAAWAQVAIDQKRADPMARAEG